MNLTQRIKSFFGFGGEEGSWRGPFNGIGEFGTAFPVEQLGDGWQRNLAVGSNDARHVAPVYACVMLYCRAISQTLPRYMTRQSDGGDKQHTKGPTAETLRYPNDYETFTQWVFQIVAAMMFDGEALCIKQRDDRGKVVALHKVPRRNWSIHIEPETNAIFYGVNADGLYNNPDWLMPARDVVHFRTYTPRHPLIGESPIKAAAMAVGIQVALGSSQLAFFSQMNRPSGIISTDLQLNAEQMKQLRNSFKEQAANWNQGGTPILSNGLRWTPVNITQSDSELIQQQKLSTADIARVFGVPMALLTEGSGPQGGTEALISNWLSIGLGSIIENIERSLDRCFDLPVSDHIQLDTSPLLRVDFAGRIEAYVKAVQGGLMTPNEARLREGLRKIDGGDEAYLQRQMTALSILHDIGLADLDSKNRKPRS